MRETDEGRRDPLGPTSGAQDAAGASDPPGRPWTTPHVPWVRAASAALVSTSRPQMTSFRHREGTAP